MIAPSLIPRRSGVRVKTDRIDARNLARLHRAGELIAIRVPSPAEEALRDLVRAREDLKSDRRIARQRISSFLLRYGRRYPAAGARWSFRFEVWLRALRFEEPAAQAAFDHLVSAYSVRDAQLAAIDRQIEEAAAAEPLAADVARLRAFRGIDTLTAVTILYRDLRLPPLRLGRLVHGLHRAGALRALERRRADARGRSPRPATPTCGGCLVEAAWAYRHRPAVRGAHAKRLEGQPPRAGGLLLGGAVPAELDLPQAGGQEGRQHGGGRRGARALRLSSGGR